jgi:hypothetical protein
VRFIIVTAMLVSAIVTVSACSKPEVQLIDDSGTIREWVYHPAPAADVAISEEEFNAMEATGALEVTAPEGWDVRVVWGANPCQTAPTIRVRGTATTITAIEVDHGPRPRSGCADSLELHALDLRVDPASAAADVMVSGRRTE